jgi:hypothetical protein
VGRRCQVRDHSLLIHLTTAVTRSALKPTILMPMHVQAGPVWWVQPNHRPQHRDLRTVSAGRYGGGVQHASIALLPTTRAALIRLGQTCV